MRLPVCVVVAALSLSALPVLTYAQKLDKDDKAWQESVRPLMLKEEEKIYKGLKEKVDRLEFQKIFWARRDPDLATPENEFQADFQKRKADANEAYKVAGRPGSETDCGKLAIVFGAPDKVEQKMEEGEPLEYWTYETGPTRTVQGGRVTYQFDRLHTSLVPNLDDVVRRAAERFVVQPNLDYRFDKKNRLVRLEDMLPKPSPAQALLKEPRQDFPVSVQRNFLKDSAGGVVLLGMVRGEGASVGAAAGATVDLVATANAQDERGRVVAFAEDPRKVTIGPDGTWVFAYRINITPGKYTFRAGALDPKSGKGSLVVEESEAPDLNTGQLTLGSILLIREIQEKPVFDSQHADPQHPFAAFAMGESRLIPHFGGLFTKGDSVVIFLQSYEFKVDPSTSKAAGTANVSILRDGKSPVARAPEQLIDGPLGATLVGPVPLDYPAGKYVIRITVKDTLANLERVAEAPLEIK